MTPEELAAIRARVNSGYWNVKRLDPFGFALADAQALLSEVERLNALLEEIRAERIER